MMKIVVGLGNPGFKYRNTRHNIGFRILDLLAKKYRLGIKKKAFQGIYGVGRVAGREAMLFKPMTYMNLSGEAVHAVCSSHLEDKEDILVVTDDADLPFGSIRFRKQGSSGGHNGLQSIIERMGPDFARLRVGIRSTERVEDMAAYVLSPFPRKIRPELDNILENAADCIETWLEKGAKEAISRYN
ncbi:MAG: aminoacyl-tRNA hydrolase [Candidatus Omnitrophota bacterium]